MKLIKYAAISLTILFSFLIGANIETIVNFAYIAAPGKTRAEEFKNFTEDTCELTSLNIPVAHNSDGKFAYGLTEDGFCVMLTNKKTQEVEYFHISSNRAKIFLKDIEDPQMIYDEEDSTLHLIFPEDSIMIPMSN